MAARPCGVCVSGCFGFGVVSVCKRIFVMKDAKTEDNGFIIYVNVLFNPLINVFYFLVYGNYCKII